MSARTHAFRGFIPLLLALAGLALQALGQPTNSACPIDLATALRLAGAQNLDVQIARERVNEAKANYAQAREKFLPWIAPGVGYQRHEGNLQDVAGNVFDVSKQSYAAGAGLVAQVDLGEAIYQSLAARQLVRAAEALAETRRQESVYAAATGYIELARAKAAVGVAEESLRIAQDYAGQVQRAVAAGIAFKGDEFRAGVQVEKNEMLVRQAGEQQRVAATRLAGTLHLPPTTELVAEEAELSPVILIETNAALDSLVGRALAARPELRQFAAVVDSADAVRKGAKVGPWIPTIGAQAQFYGFGGGPNSGWDNFDDGQDYRVGLSWRIGPGGLFDGARIRAAEAQASAGRLELDKERDDVVRQVVEAFTRTHSAHDQLPMAERALQSAGQALSLSRDRREFGVGAVLETIQAQQDLTRARLDYLNLLALHNQSQFGLARAVGGLEANGPIPGTK